MTTNIHIYHINIERMEEEGEEEVMDISRHESK
jgi:hypothetical protein